MDGVQLQADGRRSVMWWRHPQVLMGAAVATLSGVRQGKQPLVCNLWDPMVKCTLHAPAA